jgi:hypothetical protein
MEIGQEEGATVANIVWGLEQLGRGIDLVLDVGNTTAMAFNLARSLVTALTDQGATPAERERNRQAGEQINNALDLAEAIFTGRPEEAMERYILAGDTARIQSAPAPPPPQPTVRY